MRRTLPVAFECFLGSLVFARAQCGNQRLVFAHGFVGIAGIKMGQLKAAQFGFEVIQHPCEFLAA